MRRNNSGGVRELASAQDAGLYTRNGHLAPVRLRFYQAHPVVIVQLRDLVQDLVHADGRRRLGRVVARLHVVGSREGSSSRVYLHPSDSTAEDIDQLREGEFVTDKYRHEFAEVTEEILAQIVPLFDDCEAIRIHGDCHRGNLLERPGEGILVIDFDDMAEGPPVQDLWMLLPDHLDKARREVNLILEGYEDFREFDDRSLRLIEPLRVMRILYFLAWCSRQCDDPNFHRNFPDWGSDAFWYREIADLRKQQRVIAEHL